MNRAVWIAAGAVVALVLHVTTIGLGPQASWAANGPLYAALVIGGGLLITDLVAGLFRGEWQADLLAGISIVTAAVLGQYVAGTLVVLMLSGGRALESFAVGRASSALAALAQRMPTTAHRKRDGVLDDVPLETVAVGDVLVVLPHETCPVDGIVLEGHGSMDESYLTGEPYCISKAVGAGVLSGAINGESALVIRCAKPAHDSRYAKIMQVMREAEQRRPRIRRMGDQLGGFYTPIAVAAAAAAWAVSGDVNRFLAVLVVATPCPLLIAIPVALIGAISQAARRGIVIRDPAILEQIAGCRTALFDKTGTLTYGRPDLVEILPAPGFDETELLAWVACLERYSKHPLAGAVLREADERRIVPLEATEVSEPPGRGLTGIVAGRRLTVTNRKTRLAQHPEDAGHLPPAAAGMECLVTVDDAYAGAFRFRDRPRRESAPFVAHLGPRHGFRRTLLVSGDRLAEVEKLAEQVGIREVLALQSPEQKLELVRRETAREPTLYVGDGVNDAPAMRAATVGVALGTANDVIADAAGAVILESTLGKVDELLHLGARFRRIALQSAVAGMALSLGGMALAAAGLLPPVQGAIFQEIIDVLAVLNALRTSGPPLGRRADDLVLRGK
jgi:heavy metal translocating P-type ATPase